MTSMMTEVRKAGRHLVQKAQAFRFEPYVADIEVCGEELRFEMADVVGESWYGGHRVDSVERRPDPPELTFLRDHVMEPGDVVYDVGSHHGLTTVLFGIWVSEGGSVTAFDVSAANTAIVERNAALNGLTNVSTHTAAVGSGSAPVQTYSRKSNSSVATAYHDPVRTVWNRLMFGATDTPLVSLDDYARTRGVWPTVVKIDVEGYELEVLRGASEVLGKAPKLVLEVHAEPIVRYGGTVQEVLDFVDVERYRTWVQLDTDEPPVERPLPDPTEIEARAHIFAIPRS